MHPICQGGQHAQDEGGKQHTHGEAVVTRAQEIEEKGKDMFVWSFIYSVN